jgi:NADH-quinone oxidoreductase subunit H
VGVGFAGALVNALLIFVAFFSYLERRVLGRFQTRLGPNRVGPFGLLQPLADILKLILKEDIRPTAADRLTFFLAPIIMVASILVVVAVVPFGRNSFLADLNVGVLFIIAITTVPTLAIFLGGWGSGNRFALLGATRAVAMLISYEVPMVLSLVGVLLLAGSMSLVDVVEAQRLPFVVLQPLGFFVFFAAVTAESNRAPFDLLEAESELVAGFHTEYSGTKFALLFLAEYAELILAAAVLSTLFLRGWENPFLPIGWVGLLPTYVWFLLKVFFFLFVFIWIRATVPRLRIDQVMAFAWKVLFPLSIINLMLTATLVVVWPQPTTAQLWAMAAINGGVALGCLVGFSLALERNRKRPTESVRTVRLSEEVS